MLDGFVGRFMSRKGWAGTTIALPGFVVILYYAPPLPEIRVHEFEHVAQKQALGLFGFWFNYIRNTIRFGYQQNPMELAAYAVEAERPLPSWSVAS